MLEDFGDMFFFQHITEAIFGLVFPIGITGSRVVNCGYCRSLRDEVYFLILGKLNVPTLILHGIHDKVCPFPLGEVQKQGIKNSKLIPFEYSGHGLFYEERDKFNKELIKFIEE